MKALPPNFELLPVTPADAPDLVSVYFAAFQSAHSLHAWPRIPTIRKWWEDMLARECEDEHSHMLKIVDSSNVDPADVGATANGDTSTGNVLPRIVAFGKMGPSAPQCEDRHKLTGMAGRER